MAKVSNSSRPTFCPAPVTLFQATVEAAASETLEEEGIAVGFGGLKWVHQFSPWVLAFDVPPKVLTHWPTAVMQSSYCWLRFFSLEDWTPMRLPQKPQAMPSRRSVLGLGRARFVNPATARTCGAISSGSSGSASFA